MRGVMNPGDEPNESPENHENPSDEFEELNSKEELTEEDLQKRLNSYAEALRKEFEEATKAAPSNVEEYTRDFFKRNIHAAAAQVVFLSSNAESETVRLKASQYVIEMAIADGERDGDPIRAMLKELNP